MSHHNNLRILFIGKKRSYNYGASYGLYNSCLFLANALRQLDVECKVVMVNDNNDIDREVHHYKPTHVFLEAIWVVPEKLNELIPRHKKVQWFVRLHSNTPFLSGEGNAIDWIKRYDAVRRKHKQFHIAGNALKLINDFSKSLQIPMVYAPNIYCPDVHRKPDVQQHHRDDVIKIGGFGSLRHLKNQLIQAMAAMAFADELGRKLEFHINHSPIEVQGEPIYKNLINLFKDSPHKLVIHKWCVHEDFLKLVKSMDLGMQVSMSETFNIIAADFVYLDVPVVASNEVTWMNNLYKAECTDLNDIVAHLWLAWAGRSINLQRCNTWGLQDYNSNSLIAWDKLLFPIHKEIRFQI
jgi:hypothetical protein